MGTVIQNRKLDSWLGTTFVSSSAKTEQFRQFAQAFRREMKQMLPKHLSIAAFSVGHFYVSGFIRNGNTGKLAYFSISDVRFWPGEWYTKVLVRTAKSTKDFTGGMNQYVPFYGLPVKLLDLTE